MSDLSATGVQVAVSSRHLWAEPLLQHCYLRLVFSYFSLLYLLGVLTMYITQKSFDKPTVGLPFCFRVLLPPSGQICFNAALKYKFIFRDRHKLKYFMHISNVSCTNVVNYLDLYCIKITKYI